MFTCSICGKTVESDIVFRLNQGQPICSGCVRKFDNLIKPSCDSDFINAYQYFLSFSKRSSYDQTVKELLDYYLEQNREKYEAMIIEVPHQKVTNFIAGKKEEIEKLKQDIEEEKRKEHAREQTEQLESLGLFTSIREYLPFPQGSQRMLSYGYHTKEETIDENTYYYEEENVKIFPSISEEEYLQILKLIEEEAQLRSQKESKVISASKPASTESIENLPVIPQREEKKKRVFRNHSNSSSTSYGAELMKFLACITWISGLIISIVIARQEIIGYYSTKIEFSWKIFFISILSFCLAGSFQWSMAECLENIHLIKDHLINLNLEEEDKE